MRKLLTVTAMSATMLCSTQTLAADNTIFSCTATNGKPITVQKQGQNYQFRYDKTTFKNPIKQVLANKDSYVAVGSGFVSASLEMRNNGISYTIAFAQPRSGNVNEFIEPGVAIGKTGSENYTVVYCDTKKKITEHFDMKSMRQDGL